MRTNLLKSIIGQPLCKVLIVGVIGSVYLMVWIPLTGISIPCFFYEFTGLYCPGCGLTRALASLLRIDIYQSFRLNALLYIIPPVYLLAYVLGGKYKTSLLWALLVIALGYGVLRNFTYFSWLAPTYVN
ncbi:DUF2752 domain-containing protein [Paenibacillus alvei]|uniref:DUF2752 domain-containing protein n=2 Tax=Paenibacillus alvei TaxID=44250 RepID=A0AAP6ZZM7_PAEAL|nr:DUF2752 domain-containing protein [Paenibacillus alvei]NEZ41014.1 DUF2752 domain-containing protein [Paenibacillus alvei]NOJ70786.1 DUF2752 domain-containing protein [Paenibacillus alvei]